ncbi:hypothetical protein EDB80DRAFT_843127 [Ilyonectria destructans]|nr:hypothetical protein EDB80DRAFT_843127 [Ilyonectria destructans]
MSAPDPFGTIVNAITLAQLLYTGISDFVAADSDEENLVAQMRLSAVTLQGFVKMFRQAVGANLGADEQTTIIAACDVLQPEIEKIRDMFAKIPTEDSKWKRLGLKVAWVSYRKRQLEAVAAHLRNWSSLFNELKSSLSKRIRDSLEASQDQGASGRSAGQMITSLSASFSSLAVTAAAMEIRQLRRDATEIHLQSTLGRLRPAEYLGAGVLVEYKSYDSGTDEDRITYIEEQIGRLCNFLSLADSVATGILASAGYIADPQMYRFGLVFKIPRGYELPSQAGHEDGPVTLRSIIAQGTPAKTDPTNITYTPRHALDARVSAASMIAVALFFLHSYGWVHENLRTSNILILAEKQRPQPDPKSSTTPYLGRPFLIGFDGARSKDGIYSIGGYETAASEADKFASDLFQHPDRQGRPGNDQPRYQMNHDLYSLGVVLLEIGLWLPLQKEKSVRKVREQKFENMEERRTRVRQVLMDLARDKLAVVLGQRYQDIVVKCLGVKGSDAYNPSRFLYEIVWPLWDMKSCLQA